MNLELRPPDLDNLAGQDTGREHLSHTSISMQLSCLRKFGWSYVENLELIAKPRPLSMGTAFHKAIELCDPKAGAALLDREPFDQEDADRIRVDRAIVEAASNLYLNTYTSMVSDGQRELEYKVRLRNPATGHYSRTFDLYGFADGVIDHGDHLELIEDKFQTRIDAATVRQVAVSRQVSLTSYGLWRIFGKPVRVVRFRFTKKPSIKQRQNETLDEFVQRLHSDYAERPDFYTHEERTTRTSADLLATESELWTWAEMRRQAMASGVFPRNTDHCGDFGGCPYLPLCLGDADATSLYRRKDPDA